MREVKAMSVPESDAVICMAGDDINSTLVKVRLFRQRGEMDKVRLLLEKALVQWPQNEQVKDLLLQTEKDRLALKRERNKGSDGAGLIESPWKLFALGLFGVMCAGGVFFGILLPRIIFMVRFGFAAPVAQYSRANYDNRYYVPAHYTLIMPLFGLAFFVWIILYAVRSYGE
jgi:hypothetical protein